MNLIFRVLLFETQVVVAQLSLITEDVPFEKRYEVFSIVIYDQYNNVSKLHDLALIQVATPIVFSPNVTCMYYDETDILADNGEIMGWGATFVSFKTNCNNRKHFTKNVTVLLRITRLFLLLGCAKVS